MIRILTALALIATPLAAMAQPAALSLEHRMLLRCAATAAMVAHGQQSGDPAMADYPDLRERGRDFFIRASVRVMDEASLERGIVEAALRAAAADIAAAGAVHQMMPVCLPLIPAKA